LDEHVLVEYTIQQPQQPHSVSGSESASVATIKKTMNLHGLRDLESRLMLIVGKEGKVKDNVDKFDQVIAANKVCILFEVYSFSDCKLSKNVTRNFVAYHHRMLCQKFELRGW
jgi:hypothetical protein